jgi:hypothetical protein
MIGRLNLVSIFALSDFIKFLLTSKIKNQKLCLKQRYKTKSING